jgi:hypothetical protein
LVPFEVGTAVLLQDPISKRWDEQGNIVEVSSTGRSYLVDMNGRLLWRNCRFLRPVEVPIFQDFDLENDAINEIPGLRQSARLQEKEHGKKTNKE